MGVGYSIRLTGGGVVLLSSNFLFSFSFCLYSIFACPLSLDGVSCSEDGYGGV